MTSASASLFDFMVPVCDAPLGKVPASNDNLSKYERVKFGNPTPPVYTNDREDAYKSVKNLVSKLEKQTAFIPTSPKTSLITTFAKTYDDKHDDEVSTSPLTSDDDVISPLTSDDDVISQTMSDDDVISQTMSDDDVISPMASDGDVISPAVPEENPKEVHKDIVFNVLPDMLDDIPIVSLPKVKNTQATKSGAKKNNRAHDISKMLAHLSKAFEILGNLSN